MADGLISKTTATDIALAYRELETATKLLAEIQDTRSRYEAVDIRDAFGRQVSGLQLGVPSGENSQRLFNVPWEIAKPVIETHIATQRAKIAALSQTAIIEASAALTQSTGAQS